MSVTIRRGDESLLSEGVLCLCSVASPSAAAVERLRRRAEVSQGGGAEEVELSQMQGMWEREESLASRRAAWFS